jgi:hypothetical protein
MTLSLLVALACGVPIPWGYHWDTPQTAVRHVDAQRRPHTQHGFAPRPRTLYFAHNIDLRTCKRTEAANLKGS